MEDLRPGLIETAKFIVTQEMLVPSFPERMFPTWQNMPPVLATIMMIGLIEEACVKLVHPRLPPEKVTVGSSVNIQHVAATPVGLEVIAKAELVEIEGARLMFRATCSDSVQEIGRGTLERWIVDRIGFANRVAAKGSRQN